MASEFRVDILNINFFDWRGARPFTGGAERYAYDLALLCREFGWRPRLLQNALEPFVRDYQGVEVVGLPCTDHFDLQAMSRGFASATRDAQMVIASPLELACDLDPAQTVIGINHGIWWDYPTNRAADFELGSRAAMLDALVVVTACVCVDTNFINWLRCLDGRLLARIEYVPNYAQLERFRPAAKRFDAARLTALFPRRLCAERGFHDLIQAFDELASRRQDLDLYLCGGGPEVDEIRAREFVERHSGRVRWAELSMDEMPQAYAESQIVVAPTVFSEGTSLACIEAMATNNAVVATHVGGLPNLIIDEYNGLLIRPGAPSIVAALERLLDDRPLAERLAGNAILVSQAFSQQRWKERWRRILADAAAREPSKAALDFVRGSDASVQSAVESTRHTSVPILIQLDDERRELRRSLESAEAERAQAIEAREQAEAERDAASEARKRAEVERDSAGETRHVYEVEQARLSERLQQMAAERKAAHAALDDANIQLGLERARCDHAAAKLYWVDSELRGIKASTGWALLQFLYRIRFAVFPRGSRREWLARRVMDAVRQMRAVRARREVPAHHVAAETLLPVDDELAPLREHAAQSKVTIVFAPSVGWSPVAVQRPHHIARALAARGCTVVFDCTGADGGTAGLQQLEPGLFLYSGAPTRLTGLPRLVLWTFPYNYDYRDHFADSLAVVYDWIDDLSVFPGEPARLALLHERALREATHVFCVAESLRERVAKQRPDAIHLPNAVEYERFRIAPDPNPARADPGLSSAIASGRPIAGFYGSFAQWFDFELLEQVIARRPDWEFVLIGPDLHAGPRLAALAEGPNVHWLGPRDYRLLAGYLHLFDAALIPFRVDAVSAATSPLKLFEYLAAGKPVVSTPMPECERAPGVRVAATPAEFAAALDETRGPPGPEYRKNSQDFAARNTWDARVELVLGILGTTDEAAAQPRTAPPLTLAMRAECCGLEPNRVSVVLPVYNQAALLASSIDSVLAQTYPLFELIVVDDGSTDAVDPVLRRYAGDHRVHVLQQPNQGLAKALSNGFDQARGEFWTWTSADNLMEPRQLELLVARLRAEPALGMVYADYRVIDDRGEVLEDSTWRTHNRPDLTSGEVRLPRRTTTLNTVQDNFIGPCFLYRGYVGRVLGEYEAQAGIEDYDYWMRINALFSIAHLGSDELLYQYRVHDNTLSARAHEYRILDKVQRLMQHEAARAAFYARPLALDIDRTLAHWAERHGLDAPHARPASPDSQPGPQAFVVSCRNGRPLEERAAAGRDVPIVIVFEAGGVTPYDLAAFLRRPRVLAVVPDARTADRVRAVSCAPVIDGESGQAAAAIAAFVRNAAFVDAIRDPAARRRERPAPFRKRSERTRILLQTESFTQGGMENVVIDLGRALVDADCDVDILVLGKAGDAAARAAEFGLAVTACDGRLGAAGYRALLEQRKIDIVNAHYSGTGAETARDLGIPFVQTIHNAYVWLDAAQIANFRRADSATRLYTCVSALAAKYADAMLGVDPARIRIVPNGIDASAFDDLDQAKARGELRSQWRARDGETVYLNVASIMAPKAQLPLVEAFAQLPRNHDLARLVLLGGTAEPAYANRIRRRVRELGIAERVVFAGFDPRASRYFCAADVFVLPSFWEGWSLALGEALYAGLPIVATRVGSAGEFAGEDNLVLVEPPYRDIVDLNHANIAHHVYGNDPAFVARLAEAMGRACEMSRRDAAPELRARLRDAFAYTEYARIFRAL